jgi:hypothetical protein
MNHLSVFAGIEIICSRWRNVSRQRAGRRVCWKHSFAGNKLPSLKFDRQAFLSTVLKRLCLNHLNGPVDGKSALIRSRLRRPPVKFLLSVASDGIVRRCLLERLSLKNKSSCCYAIFLTATTTDRSSPDKSTVTCRQLLSRARQHLVDGRARFFTHEQLQRLVQQFIPPTQRLNGLVSVLG